MDKENDDRFTGSLRNNYTILLPLEIVEKENAPHDYSNPAKDSSVFQNVFSWASGDQVFPPRPSVKCQKFSHGTNNNGKFGHF